jgi:NADH pyrophosphatase NudC (nudix superfamily)
MITPKALNRAYMILNPGEHHDTPEGIADGERIMGNWLERLKTEPDKAVALSNWAGKVTTALFCVLGLKVPKTKRKARSCPLCGARGGLTHGEGSCSCTYCKGSFFTNWQPQTEAAQ